MRIWPRSPKGGVSSGGGSKPTGGSGSKPSGGSGSSSSSVKSSSSSSTKVSIGSWSSRTATMRSAGGGKPLVIPAGNIFAGRQTGGATRDAVYGTPRYGSGYPYGSYGSYVGSRPFPFGFWPVFIWPAVYYGNHEYGPAYNGSRPGGNMTQAQVTLSSWTPQRKRQTVGASNETAPYYIIGDWDSVNDMAQQLTANCSALVSSPEFINDTYTAAVQPEQVLQYYRSSSFVLALTSYDDSANSFANQPASNDSAALPTTDDPIIPPGTNLTFLDCLNTTIGTNLAIMDSATNLRASTALGQLAFLWTLLYLVGII